MPTEDPASPDSEDVRIGATIRALRQLHGLTAVQLGALVGKSDRTITAIERGQRHATYALCRDIAGHLGVPLAAITVKDYRTAAE